MDCDEAREGYSSPSRPAYPVIHYGERDQESQLSFFSARAETYLGIVIAIAGGIWAVYGVMADATTFWDFRLFPPCPAEICALGMLVWLHGQWRHSAKVN